MAAMTAADRVADRVAPRSAAAAERSAAAVAGMLVVEAASGSRRPPGHRPGRPFPIRTSRTSVLRDRPGHRSADRCATSAGRSCRRTLPSRPAAARRPRTSWASSALPQGDAAACLAADSTGSWQIGSRASAEGPADSRPTASSRCRTNAESPAQADDVIAAIDTVDGLLETMANATSVVAFEAAYKQIPQAIADLQVANNALRVALGLPPAKP